MNPFPRLGTTWGPSATACACTVSWALSEPRRSPSPNRTTSGSRRTSGVSGIPRGCGRPLGGHAPTAEAFARPCAPSQWQECLSGMEAQVRPGKGGGPHCSDAPPQKNNATTPAARTNTTGLGTFGGLWHCAPRARGHSEAAAVFCRSKRYMGPKAGGGGGRERAARAMGLQRSAVDPPLRSSRARLHTAFIPLSVPFVCDWP